MSDISQQIQNNKLSYILDCYTKILPKNSFPWIMLTLAAAAQFFAWFGGAYFFPGASMIKKILSSWGFALIQLAFLVPGINISVALLNYSESYLSIIFHVIGIIAFIVLNRYTLKSPFNKIHGIAFIFIIIGVIIAGYAEKSNKK
jgi:uncharacterized protein (DUF486 family)